MFRNLTILFLFLSVFYTKAQHPYFYSFNDENGLPTNEVYQIVNDKNGYIWIGCDAGLFRYDGIKFLHFYNSRQNARSISGLTFDSEGDLWCKNFSGQLFRVNADSLLLVGNYSKEANKFQIGFCNKPGYWKINKNQLTYYNSHGKIIKIIPLKFNQDLYGIGIFIQFFKDNLWIEIPEEGLFCYNEKNQELELVFPTQPNVNYQTQQLLLYNQNLYLIRCESGPSFNNSIYKIDTKNKKAELITTFKNTNQLRYYYYYEDKYKNLWVCSSQGAIKIKRIEELANPQQIIFEGQKISSVCQDNEGNYWFSDLQNGIYFIPEMNVLIQNKNSTKKVETDIYTLHKLNDSLILTGHYNGDVYLYNTNNKTHTPLKEINSEKGITVKDIERYNNKLYISRGHLLVYNDKNQETFYPEIFGNARDLIVFKDSVFAVHPEYLTRFALKDLQKNKPLNFEIFYNVGGRKVEKDPEHDILYFALNDGLVSYRNGKITPITLDKEGINAFTFARNKNSVWAGTHAQGILELKNGKLIRNVLDKNALSDLNIKIIFADDNYVWAFTNSNFIRINTADGRLEKYSSNIGINSKDVTSITKCNNQLYIGTKKSLIKIPVNLNPTNTFIPPFYIEKAYYNDSIKLNPNTVIPFDFSNLKFEFISFSYRSKKDLKYQYRLLGFDSTWQNTPYNSPFVMYSSLPAGTYTFEAKAVNESEIASKPYLISFTVATPIWQKGWFYFIMSLFSIGIVIAIARYQIRVIKKRNEAEKKLIQSQLTALKAQMNPHFMYNALNSIQALILKQDIKNSNLYLSKFSSLMRKILDSSGKEHISLQEEIEILELYLSLEKLRFGNDFTYSIKFSDEIDTYHATLPPLLLQPFVENAIKHGLLHKKGEKKLEINFFKEKEYIICSIKDNGIGRKHALEIKDRLAEKHISFSTKATEKRMDLLNYFITSNYEIQVIDLIENDKPAGTEVRITIPL